MSIKHVDKLPKCNFCTNDAKYDAPTTMGSWAYMCLTCAGARGGNLAIGTEFVLGVAKPKMGTAKLAQRISEDECECPGCGSVQMKEPDCSSEYNCEECGIRLKPECLC